MAFEGDKTIVQAILHDRDGDPVEVDPTTKRLATSARVSRASDGAEINPATEETLAAAKVDLDKFDFDGSGNLRVYTEGTGGGGSQRVEGRGPAGSALVGYPVPVAATDSSGVVRTVRSDESGHLKTSPAVLPGLASSVLNLTFAASDGAHVAAHYKRVFDYTVPAGWSGYLIRFTSWQNEAAYSRVVAEKGLGTLAFPGNTYVGGSSYTDPQWARIVEAEVTTALGSGSDVVVTVTYTNNLGVSGRTGTFSFTKSSIVGTRAPLVLQAGDLGVRSIQGMSVAPSGGAGAIKVLGLIVLAIHFDLASTAGNETIFAPAAVPFPTGTILGLEYAGGTVSKDRHLGAVVQLVQ